LRGDLRLKEKALHLVHACGVFGTVKTLELLIYVGSKLIEFSTEHSLAVSRSSGRVLLSSSGDRVL
jgi:hypothetical protein